MRFSTAATALLAGLAVTPSVGAQPAAAQPKTAPTEASPPAQRADDASPASGGSASQGAPPSRAPKQRAQADAAPVEPEEEDDDPTEGTARSARPDERAGRLTVSAIAGLVVPFGHLTEDLATTDAIAAGPAVGGAIAFGLSRYASVEARARYATYSGADRPSSTSTTPDAVRPCAACTGAGFDVGLGLVYHATQALAFDPWISFGAGWRSFTVALMPGDLPGSPAEATFRGIDVARFGLGGDFFPLRSIGIGLGVDLALGTHLDAPGDKGGSVYGALGLGLRLTLDPLGAVSGPRSPAPAATGRAVRPGHTANNSAHPARPSL